MAFQLVLTPQMWMLITMMLDNALAAAIDTVSKMSPDEITAATAVEEERKKANMLKLDSH